MFRTEDQFQVVTPQGPVYGTLQVPTKARLAALFIGGSGPHDRDGQTPNLHAEYNKWAQTWVDQGIAILRLDKPGSGRSPLPTQRPARYAHDISRNQAALDALADACPTLPLGLIGHSLGALTALEIHHDRLVGRAHLCGAGRTLDRLICDQVLTLLNHQQAPQDAIENHLAERLNVYQTFARGEILKDLPPWAGDDVEALIWIGDVCRHDPVTLISQSKLPLCLLMGTRDDRVYDLDAKMCRAAAPKAPALIVEGMDHFLKMPDGSINEDALGWVGKQLFNETV